LDIGSGHGLYSAMVQDIFPYYQKIDILDISESSLDFTKGMLGEDRVEYHKCNLLDFNPPYKYDLVIMGEVVEHMDKPSTALRKVKTLLGNVLFLTAPTNAPAIDHIYLFKEYGDVARLVNRMDVVIGTTEVLKASNGITELIGIFALNEI
jgi:2-polyprenyl-3-methyl-5-hydroxy-6-metoxy-1,4-benzoquinol methylase